MRPEQRSKADALVAVIPAATIMTMSDLMITSIYDALRRQVSQWSFLSVLKEYALAPC
jgi:hypothetical protein